MSIATISDTGRQLNKLYEITVEITISNRKIQAVFYSTRKIDTLSKLGNFLNEQQYNKRIRVFGSSYSYQSDVFYLPVSIKYESDSNRYILSYYVNDGDGWRISYFSNATFFVVEV